MKILDSGGRAGLRRRSVASIIAFMFLFAALYTAGVGFFLYVNGEVQNVGQASANGANAAQQASLEKLGVSAHLNGTKDLYLSVNNTGGISSTILEVYVACNAKCPGGALQGQLISNSQASPGSHYLNSSPKDLNVSLPITLPIGTSTKYSKSCGGAKGCDIGIKKAAFPYSGSGEVVVASVLTADGNVFSAQYPPPPLPSTVNIVVENNSTLTYVNEVGGPSIAMQIVASPAQTFSCMGCVNATVFVYNYASVAMTHVNVTLNNPPAVTGTAILTLFSACQPQDQTIAANSVEVIRCKYSAVTGVIGGFGSFSGTATGDLNGNPVTSAEANSNPIQIGGLSNVPGQGAFTGNFFVLKYSSCIQNLTGTYPFFLNGTSAKLVEGQPINTTGTSVTSQTGESLPTDVAVDSSGNLWVADYNNNRILEYPGPYFSNGEAASIVIGQASFITRAASTTSTGLSGPVAIAFDSSGNLWVADMNNNRVLEFKAPLTTGEAATVALGQPSLVVGLPNQGGAIGSKTLSSPKGLAFDSAGNLWVSDYSNNRILEYGSPFSTDEAASLALGQPSLITGNANQGGSVGPATLSGPWGLVFDQLGNLWAADSVNNRVLEYQPAFATDESATTVMGQGSLTTSGAPNPPNAASLNAPTGVIFDQSGRLFVLDSNNNRVLGYLPPYSSGEAAKSVLGQTNFVSNAGATSPSGLKIHGPSIDGQNSNDCGKGGTVNTNSCSASLTTSNSNDVIFAFCGLFGGVPANIAAPTDTAGLTWTLRTATGDAATNRAGAVYYAISKAPLSGDSITCHYAVTAPVSAVVFGVTGADLGNIFDQNIPNDKNSEGFIPGPASCTMSTSNSNDMLLAFGYTAQIAFTSGPTNFLNVQSVVGIRVDYNVVTSMQASVTEQDSYAGSMRWVMICDAVRGLASQGMAFDSLGDMWVADGGNNRAVSFSRGLTDYKGPCTSNASPVTLANLPSGSFLGAGSNFYTAYYVQVTNSFNTTLPILQYSYFFGDASIAGEDFWYLVGTNGSLSNGVYYPNYGANPPSLTPYPSDCMVVNVMNVPTDPNCFYVSPGKTATLTYAACGWSSSLWAWGGHKDAQGYDNQGAAQGAGGCVGYSPCFVYDTNVGGAVRGDCRSPIGGLPAGVFMDIVVSYLYKGHVLSQVLPFEGQTLLRGSTTSLICNPPAVGMGMPTTCTAHVVDTDGGKPIVPTGNVTFTANPSGEGAFSAMTCVLNVVGICSVTFTPSISQGTITISATYLGDTAHSGSGPISQSESVVALATTTVTTTLTTTLTTTATSTSQVITTTTTTTTASTQTATTTVTSTSTGTSTTTTTTSGTGTVMSMTTQTSSTTLSTTHTTTTTSTSTTMTTTSATSTSTTTASTTTLSTTLTSTTTTTSTIDTTVSTSTTTSTTSTATVTTTNTTTTSTTTTTTRPH